MALPIIGLAVSALVGGGISILAYGPGAGDLFTRTVYSFLPTRIVTAQEAVKAFLRGKITESAFRDVMTENGFSKDMSDITLDATRQGLSVTEISTLWFRYKDNEENPFGVNENWLTDNLKAAGVDTELEAEVMEAQRPVPTLDDIIRFAQRDVFEPEAVRLGGLMQELPTEFVTEAKKRGLSETDAGYYWASHWIFPSINQAFEMLHRLFDSPTASLRFTEKEMDTYFNVADIAPGMRERLKAIAFRPLGRIDIRRMDTLGIFGEGEARRNAIARRYQEIGYTRDDALLQADFTMKLNDRGEDDFSKTEVLQLFRSGLPKEDRRGFAFNKLQEIGFSEEKANLLLDLEERKEIDAQEQIAIDKKIADFVSGVLPTEAALLDSLTELDLSAQDRTRILNTAKKEKDKQNARMSTSRADSLLRDKVILEPQWLDIYKFHGIVQQDREAILKQLQEPVIDKDAFPSKADILGWFSDGRIDPLTFVDYMRDLGFADEFIELYGQSIRDGFSIEGILENG